MKCLGGSAAISAQNCGWGVNLSLPLHGSRKDSPLSSSAVSAVGSLESRTFSNGRDSKSRSSPQKRVPSHFPVPAQGEANRPTRRAKAGAKGGRVEEPVGNVSLDSWQGTQ